MKLPQWKPIETEPKNGQFLNILFMKKRDHLIQAFGCFWSEYDNVWIRFDGEHVNMKDWEAIGWMGIWMEESDENAGA